MLPELKIVEKQRLERLERFAGIFWLGWFAAAALLAIAGLTVVLSYRALDRADQQYRLQKDLTVWQEQVMKSQVQAWEQQQDAVAAVIAWGKYVKERVDLAKSNPALPSLPPRGTRVAP